MKDLREKTGVKGISLIALCVLVLGVGTFIFGAEQVDAASRPTRQTDVSTAAAGNQLVLVNGDFTYLSKATILARLNQIRWEACVNGYPDPRDRSNRLTELDYNEIKWSSDLEWIAQTRAAEAAVYWGHTRPNGKSCFSVSHGGEESWTENLASGSDILSGINMWYSEKQDWLKGTPRAVTGHYTSIINPAYNYVGIGAFRIDEWYGSVAGEFSYMTDLNETQDGAIGRYTQVMEVKNSHLTVIPKTSISIPVGTSSTMNLNAQVMGIPVRLMDVKWSSSNPGMASVNSSGKVTGIYCGTTTVKAVAGDKTYSFNVKIYNKPPKGTVTIRNTIANSAKRTNAVIWDKSAVKGATNYEINWRAPGASKWVKRSVGNKKRGTISGLSVGGLYEIRVRPFKAAVKGAGPAYGSWSKRVYRYFFTTKKIKLGSKGKGSFTMSWANDPKATGYQVLFTTNKNGAGAANNINTLRKGATSFTKTGLKSGTIYYVQVRALRKVRNRTYIGNISCPIAVRIK